MNGFPELAWVTLMSAFGAGAVAAIWAAVQSAVAEQMGDKDAPTGALINVLGLALIPLMFLQGFLADVWGPEQVLCLGSVLTAVAFLILGVGRSYRSALAATLLAAAGASGLLVAACVLMPPALFDNNPAAALNLGFVFVGLGALLTPTLVQLMLRRLSCRQTLLLVAVASLTPIAASLLTPSKDFALVGKDDADLASLLTNPLLGLACVVFLLYGAMENMLSRGGGRYLSELGYSEQRSLGLMAIVWALFLGSRWLAAFLLQQEILAPISDVWLLAILAFFGAVAIGNLAGVHSRVSAGWGLVFFGFCMGPLAPTLIGVVFRCFEPSVHGTVFGAVYAVGMAGSMLLASATQPCEVSGRALRTLPQVLTGVAMVLAGSMLAITLSR